MTYPAPAFAARPRANDYDDVPPEVEAAAYEAEHGAADEAAPSPSIYSVTRYAFTARPEDGTTVAEGLTMQAASLLASSLRREDPASAYGVRTMPLEQQADLLAEREAHVEVTNTLRHAA